MHRRPPAAAAAHAALAEELPELWWDGSWLVLSNRLPRLGHAPAYLHVLIDTRAGTCLASAIDDAPLGARVGSWLDAAVRDGRRPARVFTDNPKTINLGTLASWGAAFGVSTVCHPGSTAPASVTMLMRSVADTICSLLLSNSLGEETIDPAIARRLEDWRLEYNNALAGGPATTPGSRARGN